MIPLNVPSLNCYSPRVTKRWFLLSVLAGTQYEQQSAGGMSIFHSFERIWRFVCKVPCYVENNWGGGGSFGIIQIWINELRPCFCYTKFRSKPLSARIYGGFFIYHDLRVCSFDVI